MYSSKRDFILSLLITLACNVKAFDFSVNGIGYNIIEEDGQKVAQVTQSSYLPDYAGDIVIPSEVSDNGVTYCVTSIDNLSFYRCSEMTSIIIPNTVTYIGSEAFWGCSGLTSINIPNSVKKIDSSAFSCCSSLTSVFIPSSVTSLYRNVFESCPAITSIKVDPGNTVYDSRDNCNAIIDKEENMILTGCMNTTIPSSVTAIGVGAFDGCTSLTHIDFHDNVSVINFNAFYECTNLTSVDFPSSLWHIGEDAFHGCTGLTSLYIPARTTSIDDNAFSGCSGLYSIVVDPENRQYDSRNNCNALINKKKNILLLGCMNTIIPNDVVQIEDDAFKGCTGLTSIVIPSSITSIGYNAFYGCTNLQNINIPSSITEIASGTFQGCSSLSSIVIPNSVEYIGSMAFADCTDLRSIFIPNSVTDIEKRVLAGCNNLQLIIVDEGNPVYDSRDGCNAIVHTSTNTLLSGCKNTKIPNSITTIEDNAFQRLTSLQTIDIPNSVTHIGSHAFEECTSLVSLDIPNSVTSIETSAFERCTNIMSVTLSSSLTKLEGFLFEDCTSLSSIIIPNSVVSIEDGVFSGCSSLTSVTLSEQIQKLGTYAFADCSDLLSIELPNSLKTIEYGAFYDCTRLQSIHIPSGVTSIGKCAFYRCNELTSVTSEVVNPPTIDERVFTNSGNAILYVPEESLKAYFSAIGWRDFLSIEAIIELQSYTVTYDASENGTIIVSADGEEIESGASVQEYSTLTISAIPYGDYELESLLVNGEAVDNNSTIIVTEPIHIVAIFKPIVVEQTFLITYDETENGILIVAIDGEEIESGALAKENSILTVLAIPYTDYELEHLTINGNAVNNNCSIPVTKEMNIVATFVPAGMVGVKPYMSGKDKVVKYNLSGQKVVNPTRGLFIINGKKVLLK